jgi:hypothetical protein
MVTVELMVFLPCDCENSDMMLVKNKEMDSEDRCFDFVDLGRTVLFGFDLFDVPV